MAEYGVYVTYEYLKEHFLDIQETQKKDDEVLKRFVVQASRAFDKFAKRKFYPVSETRNYDHPDDGITVTDSPLDTLSISIDQARKSTSVLWLRDDLLELTTLTTKNGDTTIASADYHLMRGNKYGQTPYNKIVLDPDGTTTEFEYVDTPLQANAVTGVWGYHENWADAWEDSQDEVEDNPLSSSATTLTVNDVDGENLWGLTPRFQIGQLLRIESEYLFVRDKDAGAQTLTVIRGVNGTTAAGHNQNTQIDIFQPQDEIVYALQELATFIYRRRGAVGKDIDRPVVTPTGVVLNPGKWPIEVRSIIEKFRRDSL